MAQRGRTARSGVMDTSAPLAHSGSSPPAGDTEGSKARRVTFRLVAVLTALWVLAVMIFGLTEIVLMWLPADTLSSVGETLDLGELDLAHRAHYMSIGIVSWAVVLGVLVQLRRPRRRQAPMLHLLAIALGGALVYALRGSLTAWLMSLLTLVVPLLLLGVLHPSSRQLLRKPTWHRRMVALAAVGAGPWLVFALTQAGRQWRNVGGDSHAEMEHWAATALMALLVVACSFIGATDHSGWRLTAWIAALASVNYGLHSLAYPDPASAAPALWATAALAWGVAYATSILLRSRAAPS